MMKEAREQRCLRFTQYPRSWAVNARVRMSCSHHVHVVHCWSALRDDLHDWFPAQAVRPGSALELYRAKIPLSRIALGGLLCGKMG